MKCAVFDTQPPSKPKVREQSPNGYIKSGIETIVPHKNCPKHIETSEKEETAMLNDLKNSEKNEAVDKSPATLTTLENED